MSTIYESTVDTLREVGERLSHDLPKNLPSSVEWPDDLVDRVTDDLSGGFDVVRGAVVPAATVAVGAGTKAAAAGSSIVRRHPVLVAGGAVALVLAVVWFVRRRRTSDADERLHLADGSGATSAA